jgi:TolA-binding protein
MKTKPKRLNYGLYQDGLSIKLAELALIDNKVTITRLARTTLPAPLYEEVEEPPKELEELEDELEISETQKPEAKEEKPKTGKSALQEFLLPFSLERGKIAINAKEENVSYHILEPITAKPKEIKKKIQQELLSKPDMKFGNATFDYIHNAKGEIIAILHKGENELLNALRELNNIIAKKRFVFSLMDTNAIALMNLVRRNYALESEEYTWIVYIDQEYKVGIVMKGKEYETSFPIIITGINGSREIREIVFSKLMMEQDVSNLPTPQYLLLAGDNVSQKEVQFFQEKYPNTSVEILVTQNLEIYAANNKQVTKEQIGEYAIPIALAWQALEPQNKDFFPINLLPANIIEEQKHFKIAWHGFLAMVAIFVFALIGTVQYQSSIQQINEARSRNFAKETELKRYQSVAEQIENLQREIAILEQNMSKTKHLTENRNLWYYILYKIAGSISTNRISWINDLRAEKDGFKVNGYTTERANILGFSTLFPNGKINHVSNLTIMDVPVWEFNIDFLYPTTESIKEDIPTIIATVSDYQEDKPSVKQEQNLTAPISKEREEDVDAIEEYYLGISQKYLDGDINEAYDELVRFVKNYPKHPRSYNAQYLIGECLYNQGRIDEAIAQFELILQNGGSKTPDALMMLGNCYTRKNLNNMAVLYWTQLIQNFPENDLAYIAKSKINKLKEK